MNKKLLNSTLKYYLTYSLIVLIVAAPFFYLATQILYIHETDEGLLLLKKEFVKNTIPKLSENDIHVWNKLNRNVKINKEQNDLKKDFYFYKSYYDTLELENEPYRVLIAPVVINGKPYTFFARNNLVENEDFIISIAILFTVIITILVIGLILITRKLSIQLWKPFYEILKLIENFEIDKPNNQELNYTNIEEFNRLNQAINKLIEKNTFIFKSQKEFIENAAHELQTPIAIFKGKLETLLQRADVTKEQFKLLDELNNATTRLNKLNKNLLLLSKIESKQFNMPAKVNLGVIINNQLEFFKEQAIAKNISIDLQLKQNIFVQINSFLSEILISNMFLNAINHNIQNGRIKITLDEKSLIFSNSGTLIPLEEHKLFDRFSKSNPSSKGNGLGLSIVKKIAADNNWKVKYYFKDNFHYFEIVF